MHRTTASNLVKPDGHGNHVHEFRYRGKTYMMVPGGSSSFGADSMTFTVWLAREDMAPWERNHGPRQLTMGRNAEVDILTYASSLMGSVLDDGCYAPIPAEPDAADLAREAKEELEKQITGEVRDYMRDFHAGRIRSHI